MGFHGDERPNPRLEQELFHTEVTQTQGINFDKYDDIPVDTSEGCPEPFLEFSKETVGDALLKNLALTKYTKPTPVQKVRPRSLSPSRVLFSTHSDPPPLPLLSFSLSLSTPSPSACRART